MAKRKSWEVSDSFRKKVEPIIPPRKREPNKKYQRKPYGGRTPMLAWQILEGIVYVLRTGAKGKPFPRDVLVVRELSTLISFTGCKVVFCCSLAS